MAGKAILILENPWWTPYINKKRASVLPFFQGMENFLENFSVYHSFFYESNGFRAALKDDLTNTREDRLYIYIASHGSGRTIAGCGSAPAIKLTTIFSEIEKITQTTNIEGVVLGSCEVGNNIQDFKDVLIGTRIAWIFGYTCEIDWLPSTLIDLSIFEHLTKMSNSDLNKREKIIMAFVHSLKKFDGDFIIGNRENICLKDAITLVIKPRGRGNVPKNETVNLRQELNW